MRRVILAPHLDDEIIGCYSCIQPGDLVVYWRNDYRVGRIPVCEKELGVQYMHVSLFKSTGAKLKKDDLLCIPSRYDYHPLHRLVNRFGIKLNHADRVFYSVEMNTPWMQEEVNPVAKLELFKSLYPLEVDTICKNDKYFLFKSIEAFDEIIWASVKFQREKFHCWPKAPEAVMFLRNLHRHLFHFEVDVQQFGDNRDLEYFLLRKAVMDWFDAQDWPVFTSCEMFAQGIRNHLLGRFPDRLVRVGVWEDGENGCRIE